MTGKRHLAAQAWRYGRVLRWVGAGLCVLLGLTSLLGAADSGETSTLTVAARDITSGTQLVAADLTTTISALALDTPAADLLVGEVVRGPLAAGEPVTRSRLVPGGSVAPAQEGTVVFPLPLADERIAALLQSGDRVDVLVTPDTLHDGEPRQFASDVEVLGVPTEESQGFGPASPRSGSVVLLGVTPQTATDLAAIRRSDVVSVAIR